MRTYCYIYFKEKFGSDTVRLIVSPGWTLKYFIEHVTPILCREFEIPQDKMELVESGQCIPGVLPENAPALNIGDGDEILGSKWGDKLKLVAFYVRKRVEPLEAREEREE